MTHREALDILSTLRLSASDAEDIHRRLSAVYQSKDDRKRLAILDDAKAMEADRRSSIADRFGGVLAQARSAFLIDSAYVVAIAETASADQRKAEYRANPEQQRADVLRWHSEGAGQDEIRRLSRMGTPGIQAIIRSAPERPQKAVQHVKRTESAVPAHRPVVTTWMTPTKTAEVQAEEPKPAPKETQHSSRTHGTVSTYNWGCRCDECSEASASHGREYRARKKQANSGKSAS